MTNETAVALQRCNSYDPDAVYAAVEKMMADCPPPDVRGKTVLIKPNMLSPKKPEDAVCTHPVVVGAVVKAFVSRGARVIAGESPATANSTAAAKAVGTYDAVIANGGEWDAFDDSVIISCPSATLVKSFEFARPFIKADVIVSVAKLKTHQLMAYTGVMKNMFGLMVGLKKAQMHFRFPDKKDFSEFLVDLNVACHTHYAVMDAIVGMEGKGGPGNGDPVALGFLAASKNVLALDWTCASIVGYKPHNVTYLEAARKRGIWFTDESEIKTIGATPEELKPASFKIVVDTTTVRQGKLIPHWLYDMAVPFMRRSPKFVASKCINCGRCITICPPHVLSFAPYSQNKKRVVVDRTKCVHCFCCHEICPVEAIKLVHFVLK